MPLRTQGTPALLLAALVVALGTATASAQDGAITGTVTNAATGMPIVSVPVVVCTAAGTCDQVSTSGTGVYSVPRPAGVYYAYTAVPGNTLVNEIFDDTPCSGLCDRSAAAQTGVPIAVQSNKTRTGIDFALAPAATVAGRITDAVTGAAIQGVTVIVWAQTSNRSAVTDGSGDFVVAGLGPGTYFANTVNLIGYVDETFGGQPCVVKCFATRDSAPGDPIVVASGATVSGRNFALTPGGTITGRVTDAASGGPLQNFDVTVIPRDNRSLPLDVVFNVAGALSDPTGAYVVRGLPAGSYVAVVQPRGFYSGEVFNDVLCPGACTTDADSGAPIRVVAGATTGGIDFALSPGGTISGVVSHAVIGLPMTNVAVHAFRRVGLDLRDAWGALSSTNGEYFIRGLPPGTYYLQTITDQAMNQTYRNRPCPSPCPASDAAFGEPIVVVPGVAGTSWDFRLEPGGWVAGTITDGVRPVHGIIVSAYRQSGGSATFVASSRSLNNGEYTIRGLTAGAYVLVAHDELGRFVDELHGGVHCAACSGAEILAGTSVVVTATGTTTGRDFVLDLGGRLTGHVTDGVSGGPLAGVAVNVYSAASPAHPIGQATTAMDGTYTVRGLPTTTAFASTAGAPRHLNEIFNDVACVAGICSQGATVSTGLGIAVGGGGVASSVDFALPRRNEVPTAPTGLTATALGFAVHISWSPPSGGAPATSYVLEAGLAPGTTAVTAAAAAPSLSAPGVGPGVYYLRVRGVNAFGIGPASAEFVLVVNADGSATPLPPTSPVAWAAGSRLTMTWIAPVVGPAPTSYVVEAGTAAGLANIGVLPVPAASFSFDPVPPGFYFLRVRSRVGTTVSGPSPEVMITVGNVPAPPSPPQALSSSVAGLIVTFTWTAPAIGTPTSYVLEAGSAPGLSNLAVFDTGSTATTLVVPGVPPGAYLVRLRARNAQGNGVSSNERLVVVP